MDESTSSCQQNRAHETRASFFARFRVMQRMQEYSKRNAKARGTGQTLVCESAVARLASNLPSPARRTHLIVRHAQVREARTARGRERVRECERARVADRIDRQVDECQRVVLLRTVPSSPREIMVRRSATQTNSVTREAMSATEIFQIYHSGSAGQRVQERETERASAPAGWRRSAPSWRRRADPS